MPLLPIGTDVRLRRTPVGNWLLIALNVIVFVAVNGLQIEWVTDWLPPLDAAIPSLTGYLSYQFRHGDVAHLLGNMLFLWIFGHAVCDRMGSVNYVLFYLASGVFAGVVFATQSDNQLVGASGAIAAVTTAFLVLYPRSQVTLAIWFVFVTTLQLPATVLIVFKVILWDNILAPSLDQNAMMSNVAYSAHLGGYGFGFLIALILLAVRALPRNQFDLVALGSRWGRRTGVTSPLDRRAARPVAVVEGAARPIEQIPMTRAERLREDILDRLSEHDVHEAVRLYDELQAVDPGHVLTRNQQLEIANQLAQSNRPGDAADAYEAFLRAYPGANDAAQVALLTGLICSRRLGDLPRAAVHLRRAAADVTLESQRTLALQELSVIEAADAAPRGQKPE